MLVVASCRGDGPGPPAPFPRENAPAAYHVVYRVTIPGADPQIEERWVRRPYLGVTEIKKENGDIISALLTNDDGF